MSFPEERPRRLRRTAALRELVRETELNARDMVLPFFVTGGKGVRRKVRSMPGVFRLSVDELLKDVRNAVKFGVNNLILFGLD